MATMDSDLPSLESNSNTADNSNLSESLADMDLDPGSSSEDKRSREESEAAAEEETDQSSPPTKRQRRGGDESEEEEEESNNDSPLQQEQGVFREEQESDGSQLEMAQDDVEHGEDASQLETVQDDIEMGSPLDNAAVDSSPPAYSINEEPPPYQPPVDNADPPSPATSIAEGSMISFDMEDFDDLPRLVRLDHHHHHQEDEEDASPASEVSYRSIDDDRGVYDGLLVAFYAGLDSNQRRNVTRRRRATRRPVPRPVWVRGLPNEPDPRRTVTGREYFREVMSEPWEHSDDEGW